MKPSRDDWLDAPKDRMSINGHAFFKTFFSFCCAFWLIKLMILFE